jgi:Nif-specific regulatory protein
MLAAGQIAQLIAEGLDRQFNPNAILDAMVKNGVSSRAFLLLADTERSMRLSATAGSTAAEFRVLDSLSFDERWLAVLESVTNSSELDRTLALDIPNASDSDKFLVTPIRLGGRNAGLLVSEVSTTTDTAELTVIAAMIAQSLRVEHAVLGERERLREENQQLKQELKEKYDFSHLVGNSNEMRQVYEQVSQVARSNATVLLRGESGTGKEMIANAIHYNSLRSKRAFVKINCAALPDSLIESELFGHERGAFTGADKLKRGRFEMADGGTLFLDEIGDLPPQTQVKLLRVLQEREFERLGGTETIRANIRLITATNKNLEEAISKGDFREDLYYRLNVFSIFLPPLRQRRSDILLLAEHFLEKYENEHGKRIRRISTPAIDMLMSYHFPGNVRELENAIERAVLVCDSNVIHSHHLPPTLQTAETSGTETHLTLSSAVAGFERDLIIDTLKSTSGNVAKAARQLDSTERILGYKIKKYGIDPSRFRK